MPAFILAILCLLSSLANASLAALSSADNGPLEGAGEPGAEGPGVVLPGAEDESLAAVLTTEDAPQGCSAGGEASGMVAGAGVDGREEMGAAEREGVEALLLSPQGLATGGGGGDARGGVGARAGGGVAGREMTGMGGAAGAMGLRATGTMGADGL